MSGLAGGGDDGAEAVVTGRFGKCSRFRRGAVGGIHMRLIRNIKLFEGLEAALQNGQIAVGTHDNRYLFHCRMPPFA